MKRTLTILALTLALTGCGTLGKYGGQLKELFGGKDKDATEWRTGPHDIEADSLKNWTFTLRVAKPDLSRPANGAAERMICKFDLGNGKLYYWFRVGRNYGVKHRAKGGTNYDHHVSGNIAAVPAGESKWTWDCVDGIIVLSIDGNQCAKYPLKVPGARLDGITISHDAGRPLGVQWADAVLTAGD